MYVSQLVTAMRGRVPRVRNCLAASRKGGSYLLITSFWYIWHCNQYFGSGYFYASNPTSVSNSTSGLHEAGCTGAGQLGRQGPRDMGAGGEGEGRYGLARKAVNKDGLERKAVNKGSSSIGILQSEISVMDPLRRKERKHITFTIA